MELQTFIPPAVAIALALGMCIAFLVIAAKIGQPRRVPHRAGNTKMDPFECGSVPIGSPRGRYSIKFYQVAILFLVFDIEAAFMYPWALLYRDVLSKTPTGGTSFLGFAEMLIFVAVLVVALAYVWRKKAIGWE